ncbi:MAG: hypothetical protein C0449_03125 [Polaromonas sp.]|nr:hypothetical protein [Polaromonas sp.]
MLRHRRCFFSCHPVLSAVLLGWPLLAHGDAPAQAPSVFVPRPSGSPHSARPPNALYLHNRHIVTFRATLLGDSPADRVELASAALSNALQGERATVTQSATPDSVRFELNGRTVFFLVAADMGGARPETVLETRSREVQAQLQKAVAEALELRDRVRVATDLSICLGASLLAWLLVRCTLLMRVRMAQWLHAALHRPAAALASRLAGTFAEHTHVACRLLTNVVALALVLLILDTWASFVLLQFAWTRPWGEQSSTWLLEVLRHFASSTAAAVPGLVVACFIVVIARMVSRANAAFMHRVQSGDIQLAWLDAHTAQPTRRVCDVVLWLFAAAMAYPYLPGAETEAFRALSVMAGLMLSLGASSAVGQALSGLSLMYSRSLRVGQQEKIGETEGTVVALGMFTTRLRNAAGEDVSLPNKLIFGLPIRHLLPEANEDRGEPSGKVVH